MLERIAMRWYVRLERFFLTCEDFKYAIIVIEFKSGVESVSVTLTKKTFTSLTTKYLVGMHGNAHRDVH